MRNLTIVTGFSPDGYELYGKKCIDSLIRYWPKDITILSYVEKLEDIKYKKVKQILINSMDGLSKFLDYAKDRPSIKGEKFNELWLKKEIINGYSYRFDAYKFSKMAFYTQDAANRCKTEYLLWLDGDTVTFNNIPDDFISGLMTKNKICAYLGRENKHTECGFVLFRLPEAIKICNNWANYYATLKFLTLREWHSSYVFDDVISNISSDLLHNMTPKGSGHVWFKSVLGKYMDHLKGNRKLIGHSTERYK